MDEKITINEIGGAVGANKPKPYDNKLSHSGKTITKIEVSPNEKYLITYSEEDDSIICWNVGVVVEGQLEPGFSVRSANKIKLPLCPNADFFQLVKTYLSHIICHMLKPHNFHLWNMRHDFVTFFGGLI